MGFVILMTVLGSLGVVAGYCLPELIDAAFEKYEKIRGENSDLDELIRLAGEYPDYYLFVYMNKRLVEYPDHRKPKWKGDASNFPPFHPHPPSDSTFVP